jgi:hypothetical protein
MPQKILNREWESGFDFEVTFVRKWWFFEKQKIREGGGGSVVSVGEVVLWKKGKRVLKEEERGYAID